jgi:glycine/D-amino acid oxidase-like deaminating enzyme
MQRQLESFPPLTPNTVGRPPWRPPTPLPPAIAPDNCDVVIVGAGITGLAAASVCARAGRHVVVLERAYGTGATARSGGIVLGETVEGPDPDFEGCDETLRTWIQESRTDCDLMWCGCLELARDAQLLATPIDWRDRGPLRLAGQVSGGVLDPSKLQMGLADDARAAGATIVDGTVVLDAGTSGKGLALSTDHGLITAACGIMAVDAMSWRQGFDPWSQRVMTVALHSSPLGDEKLETLGLAPHQAFYTVDAPLLWGRVMPDRSLLVGRETEPFPKHFNDGGRPRCDPPTDRLMEDLREGLDRAGARLSSRVRALHPTLREIVILEIWTGPIARTAHGRPTIVADPLVPELLWAGGYGGQGIAQAFRLGQLAAERVLSTR